MSEIKPGLTRFAPGQRVPAEKLRTQVDHFAEDQITRHLLDAIPTILVVLNECRQVVYANQSLFELLGVREEDFVHGLRPGEILGCVHADAEAGGCGTSEACSACGAIAAILGSLSGRKEIKEVRLSRNHNGLTEALDLMVWATPFDFQGERFSIFAISDISHEKRRTALERIFYHDILNVVGSIKGFAEILRDYDPEDRQDIFETIHAAAEQTIGEIVAQRTLAAAESRELQIRLEPISATMLLQQLRDLYRHRQIADGLELVVDPASDEIILESDRTLLTRILGNMIKNALEATPRGGTVTVGCHQEGQDQVAFRVHNAGTMDRPTQLQIFQRSFSSKGPGRGLGTYSIRLLSENLGGKVSFISDEARGTIFCARFPLTLDSARFD